MSTAEPVARADLPAPRGAGSALTGTEVLDALPDAAAVLDGTGRIVAVNRAWRMFALDNGGRPEVTGEGVDYLAVCDRAAAGGCEDASAVAAGIRAVLRGETVEAELDYSCPSPAVARWFVVRTTPLSGGVLVTHVNITRRKAAEADLARRASSDPLTGLANRTLLDEQLHRALTPRAGAAPDVGVVVVDLDGFKPVNDTFGHAVGDELLQHAAVRLLDVVRPQDTVARPGGDEFVVVAPRLTAEGLDGLVRRVRAALTGTHQVHGRTIALRASVGAHLAAAGEDPGEALRRADAAMYADKPRRR